MIVEFSIQNFRGIKDEVVLSFIPENTDRLQDYYIIEPIEGFKLLKMGLLYGPNGSGKTTILKALDFLRDLVLKPAEKRTEELSFKPFLFDAKTPRENTFLKLTFIHNGYRYVYDLAFNQEYIVSESLSKYFTNQPTNIFKRSTHVKEKFTTIKFGQKAAINKNQKEVLEANTLWNSTVLGGYLKTNIQSVELEESITWFKQVLKPLITYKTDLLGFVSSKIEKQEIDKKLVVEFLRRADFKISDVFIETKKEVLPEELIDFMSYLKEKGKLDEDTGKTVDEKSHSVKEVLFEHKVEKDDDITLYRLPLQDESSGTQRYYQFSGLLELMLKQESVFLIDELESSLHPDLLLHFLLVFLANAKQSQLIATTHYRELLMQRDIVRHDAIWFTEKKKDGSTDLYSLADFDSTVIRKDTGSIYNAYISGKIGAIPFISDYYLDIAYNEKEEG